MRRGTSGAPLRIAARGSDRPDARHPKPSAVRPAAFCPVPTSGTPARGVRTAVQAQLTAMRAGHRLLKDEVAAQMAAIRGWGGRFVLPIPTPQVF